MKTRIGGELVYPNAQNTVLRGSHRRFAWPKIHDQVVLKALFIRFRSSTLSIE